jgi:small subunit ribosomal protein S24e
VTLDTTPPVLGIGDHTAKRDAERLAALSALYQLHDTGLVRIANVEPFNHSNDHL